VYNLTGPTTKIISNLRVAQGEAGFVRQGGKVQVAQTTAKRNVPQATVLNVGPSLQDARGAR